MGSKGDWQDVLRVWASTGFHLASPGPAVMQVIHCLTGLPAGSLRTLLTSGVTNRSRPRWAARPFTADAGHQAWGSTIGKPLEKDRL
jgi:hypothetical protein